MWTFGLVGGTVGYLVSRNRRGVFLGALAGAMAAMLVHRGGRSMFRLSGGLGGELSRPSCLECVEKHLGAAMVQTSEIDSGYPYRLRVVGHLHEAEDESRAFPALHNLIRETRKAYQSQGRLPDWQQLGAALVSAQRGA